MNIRLTIRFALLIPLLLTIATSSFAAGVLSYTPRPAVIGARPGDTVDLVATLRNTGDETLYVNDVSPTFNGAAVSYFRRNPFFNFFNSIPGTFDATDSDFTGSVYQIVIAPDTPLGTYTVTVGIVGGGDRSLVDPASNAIGSTTFTVIVVPASVLPYSIPLNGEVSVKSTGGAGAVTVGYGSIQPFSGSSTPAGLAIIGFRQNNVLVSEAGVPATPALSAGRIYAEVNDTVHTGVAMANPNNQAAFVSFYFTNAGGDLLSGTTAIPANEQIAAFLDQAPFSGGSSINGSFTFNSSIPIAVTAIRSRLNERGESLMTTLPLADLSVPATTSPLIFPHVADGGGWTTQIVLVNAADTPLSGTVQFFNQSGAATNTFGYSIPPRGSQRLQSAGTSSSIVAGWARVVPAANTASPSGLAIFGYRNAGVTVTEAGVPSVGAATAFRLYAEAFGTLGSAGSIQTGIAVVNTAGAPATVTVELTRLDGTPIGSVGTLSVPANGQTAIFLGQIPGLTPLPIPFQGVARVSSSSPISVTGLRARYNERLDFLVTTTPGIAETAPPSTAPVYFPQVADSGGYTSQFIIFTGATGSGSSGTLQLSSQSGASLNMPLR